MERIVSKPPPPSLSTPLDLWQFLLSVWCYTQAEGFALHFHHLSIHCVSESVCVCGRGGDGSNGCVSVGVGVRLADWLFGGMNGR